MSQTVELNIKINGNVQKVAVEAEELGRAMKQAGDAVDGLKTNLVNLSSTVQILEGIGDAISQLNGIFSELSDAYGVQIAAETRLAQAMRNTMDATDADVASIKQLCAAQQALGIIGDEVQLTGAQELATYLEKKSSLEQLIPVMNDMLAQQYGYNASCESAAQIASMLGKVMNGQTEALSRYGYKFDEAQKKVLQFGTESERAAVLARVVEESVGGMNEKMAQTDSGRMAQLSNAIGDIKEQIGQAIQSAMPFVTVFSQTTTAVLGMARLAQAVKLLNVETGLARIKSMGLAAAHGLQSSAARILGVSEMTAATATGALKVQIVALEAAMTMGLSVAITAVVSLLGRLMNRNGEAADAAEDAARKQKDSMDAIRESVSESSGKIIGRYRDLQSEWKKLGSDMESRNKFIKDNKEAFSQLGVSVGSVTEAENLFVSNEAAFIASVKNRAMAAATMELASRKYQESVSRMMEAENLQPSSEQNKAAHEYATSEYLRQLNGAKGTERYRVVADQAKIYAAAYKEYIDKIKGEIRAEAQALQDEGDRIFKVGEDASRNYREEMSKAGFKEASEEVAVANGKQADSISALAGDIENYRRSVQAAVDVENTFGKLHSEDAARLSAMHSGIEQLIRKYGLENAQVQELIKEYKDLRNAKMGAVLPAAPELKIPLASPANSLDDSSKEQIEDYVNVLKKSDVTFGNMWGNIRKIGGGMSSLTSVLDSNGGVWERLCSIIDAGLSIFDGVASAMSLIKSVTGATTVATTENTAATIAQTSAEAANGAAAVATSKTVTPALALETTAWEALASAKIFAAHAAIPFAGVPIAAGFITTMEGIMATIRLPKFAKGAIAYGPTLGLFGEYAGAAHNPEVVAPLSDLTRLIAPVQASAGPSEFRIKGRTLVALKEKMDRFNTRTR
ncbi:MAG: hypothetical protein KBS67_05525 [Bacteroidales bacterium]|nr:hypothetical protein [Candidatus Cryptobacteroides equifaecalis]